MQNKKTLPCLTAALAAVLLSVLRVVTMPRITEGEGGVWNVALFVLSLAVVVFLLIFSNRKPASLMVKSGGSLFAVGAVFTGALMFISSISTYLAWRYGGVWPYPSDKTPNRISALFVNGGLLFGVLSGVFFVVLGVALYRGKHLKGLLAGLSFAPLVWVWMRVCQYEVSYYSSLVVFRHWYDLLLLLLEMVFFLNLARYLLRVGKSPRLFGLSLCVGVVALMACVTRTVMALTGNAAAFAACGLVNAADLGVTLLAFGFAAAYRPAEEGEDQQLDEEDEQLPPVPVPADDEEEYLLSSITLTENEMEEEEDYADIHDERKPLELEDILQSIFLDMENEEK